MSAWTTNHAFRSPSFFYIPLSSPVLALNSSCAADRGVVMAIALVFLRQRMVVIIPHTFDDAQPFSSALTEEQTVAGSEVFGPLDEAECHGSSITCSDEWTVDIDDGACLGDGTDV